MFKAILVGFDGSEASERALRLACDLATKYDATLQISHTPMEETVVFAADAFSGVYVGPDMAQLEAMREAAKAIAGKAEALAAEYGHAEAKVQVGHGDPASNILALADDMGADLIVTGRRGLGDLTGLLLGSTSHAVAKGAKCACMTVV